MAQKSTKETSTQPQIGRYRLLSFIQRGKNRSLYQAIDVHTAKPVALKLIRLDQGTEEKTLRYQRFTQTMQKIAALDHPALLPILDFGKLPAEQEQKYDHAYIVTPLAAERSLNIWLESYWHQQETLLKQLPLSDLRSFVRESAAALQYAHEKKVLHLGIKPSNFLIRAHAQDELTFPHLELTDFGIALFTHLPRYVLSEPEASYALAPELLEGKPTAASDQYALAIMVYELLIGAPYIPARHRQEYTQLIPASNAQTNRLTPAISKVLQRALSEAAEDRYPSIAHFAEAFEHATRQDEPGERSYMMLGITQAEALAGANYPLLLPGQQRVTITIPPNAQAGQEIQIPHAGRPSQFGGPRGPLQVTLAIRPDPDENQLFVEQIKNLSNRVQGLQDQPAEIQQQIKTLDQKVTHIYNSYGDEEIKLRGLQDIPAYVRKHVTPGLAIVLGSLAFLLVMCNCMLTSTLKNAIVANGNGNIGAISTSNTQIAATAKAQVSINATVTAKARATASAAQARAIQNATNEQLLPNQYHVNDPSGANLIFNDLVNNSNQGQWSQQSSTNDQACFFDSKDSLYHAQMLTKHDTAHLCQTSTATGTLSTGSTFVLQGQVTILNGDTGGLVFGIAGKSSYYFYISQNGEYEAGSNNVPFSTGRGKSAAIRTGTGANVANLLAVVVNGQTLTYYINLQPVFSIQGIDIAPAGKIGVAARSDGDPTNVAYRNIKLWRY